MLFDGVLDGYLCLMQKKTADASNTAWIRFKVTDELQTVITSFRDNVASLFLIHRKPQHSSKCRRSSKSTGPRLKIAF